MCTSLPGFEPGIFWSVVRRVIRCATSPVLAVARFLLYEPSSVSDLLFVWREIWTACMHYRPKYGDVKPKQPTSPCRVLPLSATGGFSALKSVYGNVRHMKLCVKCQYCLHCESNHSFRWMPIALKDWTYLLGGLAADVFQEKCEQNEKVLARRIWTTDLRMSIWYFQLQSSALPTELSRDALVGRKIRRHKVVPGTDMYVAKPLPLRTELHVVYVMTLVLIDLRSVCVFALRNNMLNGKMCSIGGCKRTQAWHPHHIYNISIKAVLIWSL